MERKNRKGTHRKNLNETKKTKRNMRMKQKGKIKETNSMRGKT